MSSEKVEVFAVECGKNDSVESCKDVRVLTGQDYSGAVAKTDQDEINLVRKMDIRIMPTLWAMYFLYASTTVVVAQHAVY